MTSRSSSATREATRATSATALRSPRPRADGAALLAVLGQAVRERRAALGLSRRELAEQSGLSARFVAQLEGGSGNISVTNLARVAGALGMSSGSLLSPKDNAPPNTDETRARLLAEAQAGLRIAPEARLREVVQWLAGDAEAERGDAPARPVIALVGLRGAGKSTVGPLLARALERPFVELDQEVQQLTGLAVGEIFELHGESYFRMAEGRALQTLVERARPVVVAASGGIVTDPHSFYLLRERTLLVWLKATPEQHMARVVTQGDRRPMARRPNAMAELEQLLRAREPFYEQARIVAETGVGSAGDTARALAAEVARWEGLPRTPVAREGPSH